MCCLNEYDKMYAWHPKMRAFGGILLLSCLDLSKGHIFPAPQKGWKLIRFEEKGSPWQQELRRHSKKRKAASPSSTFFKMLPLPRNSTSFTWKSPTRKGKTASKPPFWGSSRLILGWQRQKTAGTNRPPCCVAICSDPKKNQWPQATSAHFPVVQTWMLLGGHCNLWVFRCHKSRIEGCQCCCHSHPFFVTSCFLGIIFGGLKSLKNATPDISKGMSYCNLVTIGSKEVTIPLSGL